MNYCYDCKHCRDIDGGFADGHYLACSLTSRRCAAERQQGLCGEAGRLFAPKDQEVPEPEPSLAYIVTMMFLPFLLLFGALWGVMSLVQFLVDL